MTTTASNDWTELASRGTDGLSVSLLWSKASDRVKVAVADETLEEEFDLEVPGAHALAAFHHPFAYAVCRGLRLGAVSCASLDLQPQS